MRFHPLILLAAASLALAACGDEAEPVETGDDARQARGEVLGGSISDSMLPLDTVTSQSPPLREEATEGDGETARENAPETGEANESEPEAESEAEAVQAPEAEPEHSAEEPAE